MANGANTAQEVAVLTFVFALPMTVGCLTYLAAYLGGGYLSSPGAPRWIKWLAPRLHACPSDRVSGPGILATVGLLVFFNVFPVMFLLVGLQSGVAEFVDIAYLVVEACLVASVVIPRLRLRD